MISPKGAVTLFDFDANQTSPIRVQDALGNVTTAAHDYRVNRVTQLTDPGGSVYQATFDPLARRLSVIEPGDTAALPTHAWIYSVGTPAEATLRQRAESGQAAVIVTREIFDGDGQLLERRLHDDTGELIAISNLYDARGFLMRSHQARACALRSSQSVKVRPARKLCSK